MFWGLLTDLLVAEEFRDAIREGDGDRVFRLWKLFQLYFRASGHTKYAFESVQLVADVKSLQSEQTAHRILWSRFVNTKGGLGHNISCDLHMEHLNCAFKTHLGTAGGNVTEKTLLRTGKALSTLQAKELVQHSRTDSTTSEISLSEKDCIHEMFSRGHNSNCV